ncbi:MAG: hypothetical protein IJ520_00240, partial [Synergistaceae bacterium]|nr:hypothetical protein [Synergistaceae bacterium]
YDITGLYSELMNFITGRLIRQEDMKRIQARYNRREQRQIVESVSGIRAYGGNFWSWLGSLAVSCVTQYFSYQNVKDDLHEGLDEELWLLKKDDIEQCNELQVKLLNSSWNLLRQYRLPDEYRLTQDSLDGFYSALNEPDPARRLRRLQVRTIERNFQAYPPYWFYRARAAQELNQGEEAAKCYAKFNEIWRPVLRRDPYKLETEKYAILTLAKNPEANKDEIKKHLAAIQENLADNDWSNNLFAGVVYFLLGGNNDKSEAIRLLEDNVIAGLETDVSGVILAQMEAGRLTPESLPKELRALMEALEDKSKNVRKPELARTQKVVITKPNNQSHRRDLTRSDIIRVTTQYGFSQDNIQYRQRYGVPEGVSIYTCYSWYGFTWRAVAFCSNGVYTRERLVSGKHDFLDYSILRNSSSITYEYIKRRFSNFGRDFISALMALKELE